MIYKYQSKQSVINSRIRIHRSWIDNYILKYSPKRQLSTDDDVKEFEKEHEKTLIKRVRAMTELNEEFVGIYTNRLRVKECLKIWFFAITMVLFVAFLVGIILFLQWVIANGYLNDWAVLPGIIAGIGGMVAALIKLPEIIGQYLYHRGENQEISKLLANIFKSDTVASDKILEYKFNDRNNSSQKSKEASDKANELIEEAVDAGGE